MIIDRVTNPRAVRAIRSYRLCSEDFTGVPIGSFGPLRDANMDNPKFNESFGPYNDLMRVLPAVRKALGVAPTVDVEVLHDFCIQLEYMSHRSLRDRAIARIGLDGLPFIPCNPLHSVGLHLGDGVVIFEAKGNPDLRWAFFKSSTSKARSNRL